MNTFAKLDTEDKFDIQAFPAICDVASRMAYDNGVVNRQEPIEEFYRTCDNVIADRTHADLVALETWITGLTEEQRDTLADGEETEVQALVATGPTGGPDNEPLANLLNDIFEVM